MSDRNTTIVTDSGGNVVVGVMVGVVAVLAVLFLVFGWHPWATVREGGPTVNITTPAPIPAPAPALAPAPGSAPAKSPATGY
jgi:hypothetical protein